MPWQEVDALQGSPAHAGSSSRAGMGRVTCRNLIQAKQGRGGHSARGGHQRQGHFAHGRAGHPQPPGPAAALGSRCPCPGALPAIPPARPSRSPGLTPRTPHPPLNAQNRRHLTNNQLRSAATGTSPARAPEVAFTADSHQRNFQK